MYTKTYKLADVVVEISSVFEYVHKLWSAYSFEGEAQISISVTRKDIEEELEKSKEITGEKDKFSPDYIESLAVYRKVAEEMIAHNVLLFHGSAISMDGNAYLFTARSGTGKSTHTRIWREVFGDKCIMVNDDKPLVKLTDTGVMIYGTPYNGKHGLGNNICVPLKAICILTRDTTNHIKKIDRLDAFSELLCQSFDPTNKANAIKAIDILDGISKSVGLYRLGCNMEPEAAIVSYNSMK